MRQRRQGEGHVGADAAPADVTCDHGGVSEQDPQGSRRYPRTFQGLIVSMVVLVVAVVAYWALNNSFHTTPDPVATQSVDYRKSVHDIQAAGASLKPIYPSSVPVGWRVTSADYTAPSGLGTKPAWSLGAVTAHHTFVGLRLEATPLSELISTYIDKDASHDGETTIRTALGDTWSTYSDRGGDTGFATQLGDDVLLVYGSASKADFTSFMQSLTQAPIKGASASSPGDGATS